MVPQSVGGFKNIEAEAIEPVKINPFFPWQFEHEVIFPNKLKMYTCHSIGSSLKT
jgi:hypothetical protein